ncbi:MAG TPA: hypothetical protein PLO41_23215, partial [Rubrivivax sp.]|nr:hypothetical protein [Rubrivivax sp.]
MVSEGTSQRFNLFQRMMLRWRELHPYNPVHVLCVPRPLDAQRLHQAIAAVLESQGLTGLQVDQRRGRYRYAGGAADVDLRIVDAAGDAADVLRHVVEQEFNRPFVHGARENPWRFVAIDEQRAFRLALAYDHYVAGGESVARLLTRLAHVLLGDDGASPVPLPSPAADGSARYRHAFVRHPGWLLRALLGLPRLVGQARRVFRPAAASADERRNAYRAVSVDAVQTLALRAAAKDAGVTLHELLTACLLLALSPLHPQRHAQPRRNALAVASIMSIRRDLGPQARHGLSPFLAAYRVTHRVPDGTALRALADDVHRQTRRVQRDRLYLLSLVGLSLSAWLWPHLTPRQRDGFYAKHFPVQAGITSIDMNRLWADAGSAAPDIDYQRAVPTGPLCPLVLAVTQVRDELRLGIAFRTGVYS